MAAIDFPSAPANGQIFSAPNGVVYQYSSARTAWLMMVQSIAGVAAPIYDSSNAIITDAATVPGINTDVKMQISQGQPLFTKTFTALNPANPIEIDVNISLAPANSTWVVMALFVDGVASAVAQVINVLSAGWLVPFRFYWQGVMPAGAHTYQIRFGAMSYTTYTNTAGTAARIGGGGVYQTISIKELGGGVQGPPGVQGPAGAAGGPACTSGPTPPASPVPNTLWFNTDSAQGGGQLYIWFDDGNSQQWVPVTPAGSIAAVATPTYDSLNTLLTDASGAGGNVDTILQITQGTQVFNRSFTAVDPSRPIEVDVYGFIGFGSAGVWGQLALFVDGAAAAVAQMAVNQNASTGNPIRLYWQGVLAAGAHTFQLRLVSSSSGTTVALNGQPGGRVGGGAMRTTMKISELR